MGKDNIYKFVVSVYFLIIMLIGLWFFKDIIIKKRTVPSKFVVLNTSVLDSSTKSLSKRNYLYKMTQKGVDINNFVFGNPNPFR
jgi:hypothetical protein